MPTLTPTVTRTSTNTPTIAPASAPLGRPPETLYVEGEGHGFYTEKNRQAFYEKLEAFLAKRKPEWRRGR